MANSTDYLQSKWNQGLLPGIDCILFGNGEVIIGNYYRLMDSETQKLSHYWSPLCDTTIDSLEKYSPDIWTAVDIYHGSVNTGDRTIVFGEGSMGNEGFVAAIEPGGSLHWAIFFTFSNPVCKAEVSGNLLVCTGDSGFRISIRLDDLTKIDISNGWD
jgi:hypothetical protein